MSLTVTLLGCGASSGVPMIGCDCRVCRSHDARNHRLRPSILIEEEGVRLLVDVTPDIRQQCLAHEIASVDAIVFTHAHADHCHGIDDVRPLNYNRGASIPAYADRIAMEEIEQRFGYALHPLPEGKGWYRPSLTPQVIDTEQWTPLSILPNTPVQPFPQWHGKLMTLGLRAGPFAYSTDVHLLPEEAFAALAGIECWIVDCLRVEESPTHAHLALTLEWIARVRPRRAILTHMSHEFDYEALRNQLPQGVEPGYDGMIIRIPDV